MRILKERLKANIERKFLQNPIRKDSKKPLILEIISNPKKLRTPSNAEIFREFLTANLKDKILWIKTYCLLCKNLPSQEISFTKLEKIERLLKKRDKKHIEVLMKICKILDLL